MTFTMFGEPPTTTHHAKKITSRGKFSRLVDTPALKDAISIWEARLLPHVPPKPVAGPVRLTIHAVFSPPGTETGTKAKRARFEAMGLIPKTTKPDCSNFGKTLEDRLVALGFLENDQSVYFISVVKFWGMYPRTTVTIEGIEVPK